MAFCNNCGAELIDGAKFCQKCGCPIRESARRISEERQREFAGKIYKCPNCGEVLKSFEAKCPACGLELRGTKATNSVREFALKLEAIEARREPEKVRGIYAQAVAMQEISKTDAQKINLIQSFAVPNTKEDILEFMILATANIDMSVFESTYSNKSEQALANAWISKVKQTYAKAHSSYGNETDFLQIEDLYSKCIKDVSKHKKKGVLIRNGWIFAPVIFMLVFGILCVIIYNQQEAGEIERLENIVAEVQKALENGEYKYALRIADSIDYQRNNIAMEQKWDIQREYWVERVLKVASENGVDLDYVPGPDIDNANDEPTDETPGGGFVKGFVDGFTDGVQPGLDRAKESIDEFNRIINGEKSTGEQQIEN